MTTRRPHLDLFSGIGGFAHAASCTGWKTIGFSEIDTYSSAVLRKHWPDVPNYGDIRNVKGIKADLVTGGFPCQPYSLAGKRRGSADDRALWPEMLRVIQESRPSWVLAENVYGIINMELDCVLSDLEAIGYATGTLVVPACAVDARHRRDRVWIVAHSKCERGRSRDNQREHAVHADPRSEARGPSKGCCRVATEPAVGRLVDGLPNRLDRLKCLGNAIVPQVAAQILTLMN